MTKQTENEMTLKECNDYIRSMGLFPQAKIIDVVDCLICGEEVNFKSRFKHLKSKHFDRLYELVMEYG